jgi:hypothetical protein
LLDVKQDESLLLISLLDVKHYAVCSLLLTSLLDIKQDESLLLTPSGKTRQRQKLGKGPENIGSEKIGEKIGKNRKNSANIKKYIIYSFFFKILNIFQYLKQQQHDINK